MAYLDKKEWQKQLKLKPHESVKKTGISDCLSAVEKAASKKDNAGQVLALEKLRDKIDEVTRKHSGIKTLTDYLGKMKKEAKVEEDKIANKLQKAAEDGDLDKSVGPLGDAFQKLRKVGENQPHNFVLAPGKPSTGLVLTRKPVKKSDVKSAMELRGKPGTYFSGTCFFDAGRFVFDFPEQPPSGMARAIKTAARLHAEMNIKVLVRGGGVEFDDEADSDLEEAGEDRAASGGASKYPGAKSFDPLIEKIKALPADKRSAAASGVVGKIAQLKSQAANDADLSPQERVQIAQNMDQALAAVKLAIGSDAAKTDAPAKSAYPGMDDWSELMERCLRLDPAKRQPAIDALRKKLVDTGQALKADQGLTDVQRKAEAAVLSQASKMIVERAREYVAAAKTATGSDGADRLKGLETRFDMVRKQKVLPEEIQRSVGLAILAARKALAGGDARQIDAALDDLENKVKAASSVADEANAVLGQGAKQKRVHDSVKLGVEVFKKGAFAPGTADMLFRTTQDVKMDSGLKKIGDDFKKCEKDPSPANLSALSNDGQKYLASLAKQKAKLDPEKDAGKIAALGAQEKLAVQAVQRVRMLEMANEMASIGAPPWDEAQNERMAELQVSFFFEEGAIQQGVAEFGAPQLGGDDNQGVNDAWWIKRSDRDWGQMKPDKDDPTQSNRVSSSTKTYIFKAQELEKTEYPGIPKNGGTAREVLASKLNDMLTESGFDVGVCPTHLVDIDSAKLGGLGATENPRTFGAVQELADNKGPIVDELRKDPKAFAKTVSHKNCSDIAAFDLMFLNLDRHTGNLLVKDNGDGSNTIVPIDHGIGLPDPEGLALSRFRINGPQNTMMMDELHCNELLDEETRVNLKKMDARAMTQGLQKKQLEAEKRHPETKGKVDPAEFDRMARRIEFMQAAADIMTAKELTQSITTYAAEINKADAKDLPKLATDLKKKLDANNKGVEDVAALIDPNPATSWPYKVLTDLGWCVGLSRERVVEWASENGDFASRVLKAKIKNPDAMQEISDLVVELKNPDVEKSLNGKSLGEQIDILRNEVARHREAVANKKLRELPDDKKARAKAVDDLGGKKTLLEIQQTFPSTPMKSPEDLIAALRLWKEFGALGGFNELRALSAYFPGDNPERLDIAVSVLVQWDQIKKLGGMKTYIELGGIGDTLHNTLEVFQELKRMKDSGEVEKTLSIDPKRIDEEQEKIVRSTHAELVDLQKKVLVKDKHAAFAKDIAAIDALIQAGEMTQAQGKAEFLLDPVREQVESETVREKELSDRLAALRSLEKKTIKADANFDFKPFQKARHAADKQIRKHEFKSANAALNKIDLELDSAINGDNSKASKMAAQVKRIDGQVAALNNAPGSATAIKKWDEAKAARDAYDLKTYASLADYLENYLTQAEYYRKLDPFVKQFNGKDDIKVDLDKFYSLMQNELTNYNPGGARHQVDTIKKKLEADIPEKNWP